MVGSCTDWGTKRLMGFSSKCDMDELIMNRVICKTYTLIQINRYYPISVLTGNSLGNNSLVNLQHIFIDNNSLAW